LLAGGIALIQWHAIAFWSNAIDQATGWAWSVLLELIALWLWYRPRTRLLAFITTALVLSGPLYQVTRPLVQEFTYTAAESASEPARASLLREAIAAEEKALHTFLANSAERSGWLPAIEQARASLNGKRAELQSLLTPARHAIPWQQVAVMVMQAIALVLIQISNVLAIRTIADHERETASPQTRKQKPRQRETPRPPRTPKSSHEPDVEQVQAALQKHLSAEGVSARAFAARHGFRPRDLSLVLHDQENRKAGKRRAPTKVFERLSELLNEAAA
jgi:hypothetical protein